MAVSSRVWLACCATLLSFLVLLGLSFAPRTARAEAPNGRATPVHVLGIDSDDAEEQADALTGALRSRVRSASGWSLQETQHSLGTLTAALRCPAKPDAACLQRIGDQLHADRFVWGSMSKSAGNQVTSDLHMWTRGKPDTASRETYSDNLKDQNDETLRKIASRIFERLTGAASSGTVALHAGHGEGQVFVDGQRRGVFTDGAATFDLPAGSHTVEIRSEGFVTAKQTANVTAGQETALSFNLVPAMGGDRTTTPAGKPFPTRKVIGWSAIGIGVALGVVAGIEGARFMSLRSDLNDDRTHVDKNTPDVCSAEAQSNHYAADACTKFNDAKSARTTGVLVGSIGAVAVAAGVVLLITDPGHAESPSSTAKAEPKSQMRVLPYLSPQASGVDFAMTF